MSDSIKVFSFNVGIESIVSSGAEAVSGGLPGQSSILPSEERPAQRLERLFDAAGLEERMVEALRPEIEHRDILVPARFGALASEAGNDLRESAALAGSPEERADFEAAARIVEEDGKLKDLLNAYRGLLLPG